MPPTGSNPAPAALRGRKVSMNKDNLVVLPGGGHEMKEFLEDFKKSLPEMKEYLKIGAELTRIKYKALLEEGFTPEQALELSKTLT